MRETILIGDTPRVMDQIYRLRHDCYLRTGAIEPLPTGRFQDSYDALPNHFSFLVHDEAEEPVATMRVSVVRPSAGWLKAPSLSVFGDHPALRGASAFVEANRLCFSHQARRDAFFQLTACFAAMAEAFDTEWLIACPREEHSTTYERLFGFERMAEPRTYFGVNFRTSLLGIRRVELDARARASRSMEFAWRQASLRVRSLLPARELAAAA